MHNVTLIKGDGIGPSIMDEAVKVIDASGVKIHWEEAYAGLSAFEKFGTPLPDETLASFDKTRLAFKGPLTTVVGTGFRSINVALRQQYELYANVRPAKSWPGIKTRYEDVDIVIVRENTEGLYAGLEHYLTPKKDIAESLAVVTRAASERVIEYAFKYAQDNNRKKVTVCHKANILKYTQGLFLDVARETAARYPDIQFDEKIVDAVLQIKVGDESPHEPRLAHAGGEGKAKRGKIPLKVRHRRELAAEGSQQDRKVRALPRRGEFGNAVQDFQ